MQTNILFFLFILLLIASACSTTEVVTVDQNTVFTETDADLDSVIARIPDYTSELATIRGKGKAIVSEPGGTERVTVYFSGNRQKSLVTIKNSLGIEGGQILSHGDSLLIYNKVDKIARRLSVLDDQVGSVGHLASVNIVDMMNFVPGTEDGIEGLYESETSYLLRLRNGGEVYIDKKSYNVRQVDQPLRAGLPYSRIVYEAYADIEGFILPRRVTIFSADSRSKVALLIQELELNPTSLELQIDLPNDVKLVTQ